MEEIDYEEFSGIDYEWFLADAIGQLAVLITAGKGPVPGPIIRAQLFSETLEVFLKGLPDQGGYVIQTRDRFTRSTPHAHLCFAEILDQPIPDDAVARKALKDWMEYSRKGLFGYDWLDVHRPARLRSECYEMVTAPENPIRLENLPSELANKVLRIDSIRFDQTRVLKISKHLGEITPS